MAPLNKDVFLRFWPKCFIVFLAIIELIAVIILFITELGNVAANFWTTNVFAGGWCGLIMLIHLILMFTAGCCSPGPKSAFRTAVLAVIGLVASAALISFDAAFVAKPTTCILTPSCEANAASNTTFSYNFRQSFFTVFNSWSMFKSYGESQVKFLCQTIQLGVGSFCFILCIIYLIIYYVCSNKSKQQVGPGPVPPPQQPYYGPQQPSYYPPPPPPPPPAEQGYYPSLSPSAPVPQGYYPPPPPPQQYYQPPAPAWRPPAYAPQPPPGAIPWNGNRRY